MPMAAGPPTPSDRPPLAMMMQPSPIPETYARDAIIAWFRGEFAAANAIIDALCNHLTQLDGLGGDGNGSDYESAFAAIHRRRLNWIPVLHMQKYFSIADVTVELLRVADKKMNAREVKEEVKIEEIKDTLKEEECTEVEEKIVGVDREISVDELKESSGNGGNEVVEEDSSRDDSSDCKAINGGQ